MYVTINCQHQEVQLPLYVVVIVLLGVGKENYLMAYCFIKVAQVLVRVGCKPTRPAMPAARGEDNERMLCTCI